MELRLLLFISYFTVNQFAGCHGEVRFVCPRPQVPNSDVTQGPCESSGLQGIRDVTDVSPGPLTLRWEETVFRQGAPSRIALKSRSENTTCVLLDQIPHNDNQFTDKGDACQVSDYPIGECRRSFTVITVTIPDIACDDCYLQLISVDTSSLAPGAGPCSLEDTSSPCPVYYSCANIKIWPTPSGEAKSLNSCLPYPQNLDGPWPFRPITTYGVQSTFSQFFAKDSIMLQGNTVTFDVEPIGLTVAEVVPGTPGLYDVPTGIQARALQSVSPTELVFQGTVELTDFLTRKLQSNELGIGLSTAEDGLLIFRLQSKSTQFGANQYLPHSALYTSRGMLRPNDPNFSSLTKPYTTPFVQSGQCAMETQNMNVDLSDGNDDRQAQGLLSMSTVEYNLYLNGILARPDELANDTELDLSVTRTFIRTFQFTARRNISDRFISTSSGHYVVDGVENLEDLLTLTSGGIPEQAEAVLTTANSETQTFTGSFSPGTYAVVRDEWDQITGLATVGFHNRTTLNTKLMVVNFTLPPQLGGLHGPALPGQVAPRILLPTSDAALRRVADSSWMVTALLTINSAQAIRHMWSGRHYIDMRRTASTPDRAISGQLVPLDSRSCRNIDNVACFVTELKPSGFSRGQAIVPTNAFVAFLPGESTGIVRFSIIVRDLQPGESVTSLVVNTGSSSSIVTPLLSSSQQESGALEGEGEFSLQSSAERAEMSMVLSTSRFPLGTIRGSLPVFISGTPPFGDQNRTETTTVPTTTVPATTVPTTSVETSAATSAQSRPINGDDFSLECGTREAGPMRITLTATGAPVAAVYAERFSDTCSFVNASATTWILSSARALGGSLCGVRVQAGGRWELYELTVVVQAQPLVQTGDDTRFILSCNFTGLADVRAEVVASGSLNVRSKEAVRKQEVIRGQVDQQYALQIHGASDLSQPVTSVVLGDSITLSITMSGTDADEQSLRVRQCTARSSSGAEVLMLDDYCSVLRAVLPEGVGFVTSGTRADLFGLEAFRLQNSPDDLVIFSCIVEPCSEASVCGGNNCVQRSNRRRRQVSGSNPTNQTDESPAVRIAVQYRVVEVQETTDVGTGPVSRQTDVGTNRTQFILLVAVCVVSALLLIVSAIVVIVACQLRRFKRQHTKDQTNKKPSPSP